MKTTALAPWFGSNRMLAENVAATLAGCSWIGVPFAGGMSELVHIKANVLLVSDLHRHIINLANCVKFSRSALATMLSSTLFHPDQLAKAQEFCLKKESEPQFATIGDVEWAAAYFDSSWMSRSGDAGTKGEFNGSMSIRWKAGGGDSAVRYRSAIESLAEWERIAQRCTFVCMDVFDFLAQAHKRDIAENGIYLDPPFPGAGQAYRHNPGKGQAESNWHGGLAAALSRFSNTRIVCRFYDAPLIRELYRESDGWVWNLLKGRKQTNDDAPEVLLVRNR